MAANGTGIVISADDYFVDKKTGQYNWSVDKLGEAHKYSQDTTINHMRKGTSKIFVANTFTTEKEMKPYFDMAKLFNYKIFTIVVENRHGGTNVHDVPTETLAKQKERFSIKL